MTEQSNVGETAWFPGLARLRLRAVTKPEKKRTKIYLGIVDLVFAVVLGASFVSLNIGSLKSLSLQTATLAVAYGSIVLSWTGYHASVKAKPYKLPLRFWIDLIILYGYLLLISNFSNLGTELWVYVLVFVSYTTWSAAKALEWPGEVRRLILRTSYPIIALVLASLFQHGEGTFPALYARLSPGAWQSLALGSALGLIVLYRIQPLSRTAWTRSHFGLKLQPPLFAIDEGEGFSSGSA